MYSLRGGRFQSLLLIAVVAVTHIVGVEAATSANITYFEPQTASCADPLADGVDWDAIGHCCFCDTETCLGSSEIDLTSTSAYRITPQTAPLPDETANLGSSLAVSPNGRRGVVDSFPFFDSEQVVEANTTVHVLDLDPLVTGAFVHSALVTSVPAAYGHTLAASNTYIAVGSPSASTARTTLFVKTSSPPWSVSYELEELSAGTEFGYALGIDESDERLAISDPGYALETGRVYVYLLVFETLLDTVDHPGPEEESDDCRFGHAIQIQNNTLVVSAPLEDRAGSQDVGAFYIFEQVGTKWYYVANCTTPNATLGDDAGRGFGHSVSLDGDWIVVGSQDSSEVEVYHRTVQPLHAGGSGSLAQYNASVWEHHSTLSAPDLEIHTRFGRSVSVAAANLTLAELHPGEVTHRIAVGDSLFVASASAQGKVFTYEYSHAEDEWLPCSPFTDDTESFHSRFGQTVALTRSGLLVVGAPDTDSMYNENGNVYLLNLSRVGSAGDVCRGCDDVLNSCVLPDLCGVCSGDNSTCEGCDGVPLSGLELDYCEVCDGDNSTCVEVQSIQPLEGQEFVPADDEDLVPGVVGGSDGTDFTVRARCNEPLRFVALYEPRPSNAPVMWHILAPGPSHGVAVFDPDDEDSIPESQDDDDNTIEYTSTLLEVDDDDHTASDSFQIEVIDTYGNTDTVTVHVELLPCIGCDGVAASGQVVDGCGVCGGDNSTCIDCAGDFEGFKIVDYCEECVSLSHANRTCLEVEDHADFELLCKHTVIFSRAEWEPNPSQIISWTLVSHDASSEEATVSIDPITGVLTYAHHGDANYVDTVVYRGTNPYSVSDTGSVQISVTLCDVEGCDGVMGSGNTLDECDVCGGNNACLEQQQQQQEEEEEELENATVPVEGEQLSGGAVVAIVLGIIAFVVVAAVVVGVGCIIYFNSRNRRRQVRTINVQNSPPHVMVPTFEALDSIRSQMSSNYEEDDSEYVHESSSLRHRNSALGDNDEDDDLVL